ncbi:MAG: hypothetical protein JSV22_00750 [Bacteroidales bacterium]|nr:MAG: hypothetical protein JSV22_00750 [Bacteroidales bacterium]
MKIKALNVKLLVLKALILLILTACSGYKDMQERKNYMIPKKSELPRNRKYKEAKKKKTYAKKIKRQRRKKY